MDTSTALSNASTTAILATTSASSSITTTRNPVIAGLGTVVDCNSFSTSCTAATPNCNGAWSLECYDGGKLAKPPASFPTNVCGRCICNGQSLIPDLLCSNEVWNNQGGNANGNANGNGGNSVTNDVSLTPSGGPISSTTATSTDPPLSPGGPSSDSAAGKLGPIVGSVVGVVLVVGLAVAIFVQRSRSQRNKSADVTEEYEGGLPSSTVALNGKGSSGPIVGALRKKRSSQQGLLLSAAATGISSADSSLDEPPALALISGDTAFSSTQRVSPTSPEKKPSPTVKVSSGRNFAGFLLSGGKTKDSKVSATTADSNISAPPGDEFALVDMSGNPNMSMSEEGPDPSWTPEQVWQWQQWQWAYQWHEWQVRQREWQAQQRAYYLAKEEERKSRKSTDSNASTVSSSSSLSPVSKFRQPRTYRPSPLSRVHRISTISASSRASSMVSAISRNNSLSSVQSKDKETPPRPSSRQSTVSSLTSITSGQPSLIIATSPEWAAPSDITRRSSTRRRGSATSLNQQQQQNSNSTSSGRPKSVVSTGSNSNNRNSHLSVSSIASLQSPMTPTAASSTHSFLNSPASNNNNNVMLPVTSAFSIGDSGDVNVISITSFGHDGTPMTTQTITLSRPVTPIPMNAGVGGGSNGNSGADNNGVILEGVESSLMDGDVFADAHELIDEEQHQQRSSFDFHGGDLLESSSGTLHSGHMSIMSGHSNHGSSNGGNNPLQMKYQVKRVHVPLSEEELPLQAGDHGVVWRINKKYKVKFIKMGCVKGMK
ncbi:hypothetical protein HDU76_012956 [Blyttiomyces sp. JEL0837]|nr:hypothetical protein HDU76_012956 [Blyttiomyces sp. JEL0837]